MRAVTVLSGNMFKLLLSSRHDVTRLEEDGAKGRVLSPYRGHSERQCCVQPPGSSNGCEGEMLYGAIKQRFIRYCTNCKEIVKAAEGCGPLRPSCKVRDQNCGAVVSRSFYMAELL